MIRSTEEWAEVTLDFILNLNKLKEMRINLKNSGCTLEISNYFGCRLDLASFELLKQMLVGKLPAEAFEGYRFYLFNDWT